MEDAAQVPAEQARHAVAPRLHFEPVEQADRVAAEIVIAHRLSASADRDTRQGASWAWLSTAISGNRLWSMSAMPRLLLGASLRRQGGHDLGPPSFQPRDHSLKAWLVARL